MGLCSRHQLKQYLEHTRKHYLQRLRQNKPLIRTLSKIRRHLFKKSAAETNKLPPTKCAFIQHVKRAFYQLSINKQGWVTKDGKWIPNQ